MNLAGKQVILGVTGSIAAYKAVYLLRLLIKEGALVRVIMTPTAKEFVGPVTFSALSGNTVLSEFFSEEGGDWNSHVDMGVSADLMLIAPVTATTLGKMANGIADNLLLTTYLSARCPVVLAPAMDMDMFKHPSTQKNLDTLRSFGNLVIDPGSGELASGLEGRGRMEEPETILEFIGKIGEPVKKKLLKSRVLITAGPTQESIDPVRYIGNYSSGKMGKAIAETFANMGAEVCLIAGPVSLSLEIPGVEVVPVTTAKEMLDETASRIEKMDIAIFSAAVADFTPRKTLPGKMKRGDEEWSIRLKPTTDIASEMGKRKKKDQLFIGFALESDHGLENAKRKLAVKNFDLILLNHAGEKGAGFGTDTNRVTMINSSLEIEEFELKSKNQVAADLAQRVVKMIQDA